MVNITALATSSPLETCQKVKKKYHVCGFPGVALVLWTWSLRISLLLVSVVPRSPVQPSHFPLEWVAFLRIPCGWGRGRETAPHQGGEQRQRHPKRGGRSGTHLLHQEMMSKFKSAEIKDHEIQNGKHEKSCLLLERFVCCAVLPF